MTGKLLSFTTFPLRQTGTKVAFVGQQGRKDNDNKSLKPFL